jgi:hypothetical protein
LLHQPIRIFVTWRSAAIVNNPNSLSSCPAAVKFNRAAAVPNPHQKGVVNNFFPDALVKTRPCNQDCGLGALVLCIVLRFSIPIPMFLSAVRLCFGRHLKRRWACREQGPFSSGVAARVYSRAWRTASNPPGEWARENRFPGEADS